MSHRYYSINHKTFVYDADGIASIRTADGGVSLYLGDEDLDAMIDALQSVQADHQRRAESIAALNEALESRTVSAVYSGRHGCACGCRGNHSSTSRSIKIVLGKMREAAKDGAPVAVLSNYISVDTDTRVYIAYTDGRVS
jgi:hypothetical protein